MKDSNYQEIIKDVEEYANFIVDHNATIRETAIFFKLVLHRSISKSAVHYRIEKILSKENPKLYRKVRMVLDKNKRERHIRGGMATKIKYNKNEINVG